MAKSNEQFAETFCQSAPDYAQTSTYSNRDWAWEFLRRNPNYQKDALASRLKRRRIPILLSGAHLYRHPGQQISAQKWNLLRFVDPRKSAREVDPFWIKDDITATARKCSTADKTGDFDINAARSLQAILFNHGAEHSLIQARKDTVQLKTIGTSLLFSPVHLTFNIDGFKAADRVTKAILRLQSSIKDNKISVDKRHPARALDTQKRALIALDCKLQKGSLQDTARVFQKLNLTRLTWSASGNEALKKQVWRHRKKGIALMQQTYRSLL